MDRVLLLSDDEFLSNVLGSYVRRDNIDIVPLGSAGDAHIQIARGAAAIIVDLAKRGLRGDDIIALARYSARVRTPLLVISAQPRRELADFAAVVTARDVLSKTEPMTAIAARLRLWVRSSQLRKSGDATGFAIPELAIASH